MKNIKFLLTLLAISFLVFACREDHTDPGYEGAPVLHFNKGTQEDAFVLLGSNYEDVKISYGSVAAVSGSNQVKLVVDELGPGTVEGVDFKILTPVDELANSENGGEFTVRVFEPASPELKKSVTFKLSSSTISNAVFDQKFTLNMAISCPIPDDFALKYDVSVFAFNEDADAHVQTLVPVAGTTNQFKVASSWGPNFVAWATGNDGNANKYLYPGVISINCGVVNFKSDDAYGTGGTGTYDPETGVIEFTVGQTLFADPFTTKVTFTPR